MWPMFLKIEFQTIDSDSIVANSGLIQLVLDYFN